MWIGLRCRELQEGQNYRECVQRSLVHQGCRCYYFVTGVEDFNLILDDAVQSIWAARATSQSIPIARNPHYCGCTTAVIARRSDNSTAAVTCVDVSVDLVVYHVTTSSSQWWVKSSVRISRLPTIYATVDIAESILEQCIHDVPDIKWFPIVLYQAIGVSHRLSIRYNAVRMCVCEGEVKKCRSSF